MIVTVWMLSMKLLEVCSGKLVELTSDPQHQTRKVGFVGGMTEDNSRLLKSPYSSALPDFDCNSNNNSNDRAAPGQTTTTSTTEDGGDGCGADYRWCLDLCYRNNQRQLEASGDGGRRLRTSVLLGPRDISYDDLARNIDANLAEIDMEHFRSEDIESILALPAMCCGGHFPSAHGEQTAELSLSLADKVNALRTSFSPFSPLNPLPNCTSSDECQDDEEVEEEEEEEEEDGSDMSVCRSSPLFSPLKEQAVLPAFSVDSLDCESYDEHELMLTCRANKNNYTIAFEGSMCKFSDDSDYHEDDVTDSGALSNQQSVVRCRNCDSIDGSLVRSDFVYTTWNKLNKVNRMATRRDQKQRRDDRQGHAPDDGGNNSSGASKSQSLPNLFRRSAIVNDMKMSQLRISTEEEEQRQPCVPVFSVNTSSSRSSSSRCSELSLVRLFMQSRAGSGSVADSYSSATFRQDHSAMYRSDVVVDDGVRCDDDPAVGRNSPTHSQHKPHPPCRAIGRVVSLDCDVRCVSPVASPIQEVDENDSSGENASSEDITVLHKISDNSCHECHRYNKLGDGSHRPAGHSRATQTCTVSKEKDACSSCSGYVSGRSSSDRNTNANPSRNSNSNNNNSSSEEGCWGETKAIISRSESRATQIPIHVVDEAIQTSVSGSQQWAERVTEERETQQAPPPPPPSPKKAVYVCYPNYSLPDLKFLRVNDACALADAEMYLKPTGHRAESEDRNKWRKPTGLQTLRKDDLNRIQDLESLCVLLPTDVRQILSTLRSEQSVQSSSKDDSSSLKQLFVYNYDSSCEASTSTPTPPIPHAPPPPAPQPPPLPKRSISLLKTGSECSQIRPDGGEMPANVLLSRPPPINAPQLDRKRDLIGGVISAVQTLVEHFSSTTDPQEKFILGSSILSPASGHLVVDNLCPALHAVLDDGILPELYSLFGRIGNSIWKVVETSTRTGVTSRALNDLVARLNSENDLQEKQKFNAFVIGLLNIRSVDSWLAFLRTQDFIIRQHYHSTSLLFQSNGAFKLLFDDLLKALQPLAVLPFDLDLMFEKLHLDCRASCCCCNCDSPTKPLAMAGGCRSDSSSLSLTPSPSSPPPPPPPLPPGHDRHTPRAPPTPKRPLQRGTSRDSAVGTSCSATSTGMTSDLESANNSKSPVPVQRPRSCATAINGSPDDVLTVISEEDARVIRRWSAMLPSAGLTADFLNDVRLVSLARKLAEESRSCSVAPSCNDNDNTSSSSAETAHSSDLGDDVPGEDFKRLQKKWEMLSGASEDSKSRCTNNASNNSNSKSKIPRLVTVCSSPNKTSGNKLEGEQWRSGSGSGRAAPPRDCSPSGRKLVAPVVNNDRAARSAASRMQPSSRIG